jgi:hypothetical protein
LAVSINDNLKLRDSFFSSDACSVSSNLFFFLPVGMPCNLLLKAEHDVLGKKNSSKSSFNGVVRGANGRRNFV